MSTHKIWIPVTAYGSNAYWTKVDFSPNAQGLHAMVRDVAGELFGLVRLSENFVGSAKVEAVLLANATSGVTRLTMGAACIANDAASFDATFTDETAQDITVPGTAYNDKLVTFPASGSLGASGLAAGKLLFVRLQHNGTHANDTLAADTLLAGLWLSYADA